MKTIRSLHRSAPLPTTSSATGRREAPLFSRILKLAAVPLVLLAVVHLAILLDHPMAALAAIALACLVKLVAGRVGGRGYSVVWMAVFGLSVAAILVDSLGDRAALQVLFLPPILINGLMLIVFGRTLLPGQEPLITRFRRVAGGELTAETLRYTRGLTIFWVLFFALALTLALILPFVASQVVWSWVMNVICPVMALVCFLAEHVFRPWFLPNYGPVSLRRTLSAVLSPEAWASKSDGAV